MAGLQSGKPNLHRLVLQAPKLDSHICYLQTLYTNFHTLFKEVQSAQGVSNSDA